MKSCPELETRIAQSATKSAILLAAKDFFCYQINAAILSLQRKAGEHRTEAYSLVEKAAVLADEVRRRAEEMEMRIAATTDDDDK